jgi:predicted sulfurtransferase
MHQKGLPSKEEGSSAVTQDENKSKKSKKNKKQRKDHESKPEQEVKSSDCDDEDSDGSDHDDHPDEQDVDLAEREEEIRLQCMNSYQPIDIPTQHAAEEFLKQNHKGGNSKNNSDSMEDEGGCRTLGKWFPNAILVKSRINYTNTGKLILLNDNSHAAQIKEEDVRVDHPKSSLVLFYQYTTSADSTATAPWDRSQLQLLMAFLAKVARHRHLGGRIRVAPEGVNATISAVDTQQHTAQETLRHLARDLKKFDDKVFANTDFKYLDHLPADRHFKEFKILPVQELVFYDIGETEAPLQDRQAQQQQQQTPGEGGGVHLDAKEYHKMLQRDNTVVIDVRNHYETILGRFDGQQAKPNNSADSQQQTSSSSGAEYIDPKMRKSTDFKSWLATPETQEKLQNKTVLMYCTGGIRCERASAYLKSQMGDQVEGVYQLKGGIERYLKTFKDGGFWRGKNFVFDKREAVGVENPEGDGGVIRKQDKKKQKKQQDDAEEAPAKCCVCGDAWDRYVGKKKCLTCGVPVLMCDKCMSLKPDKTPGMEMKVRCPLCVEENITVLASQVEFTDNGIKNKVTTSQSSSTSNKIKDENGTEGKAKAADSVLKWGGGHANKKKLMKKTKRRLCQFGSECIRKDCFFYHPERNQPSSNDETTAS